MGPDDANSTRTSPSRQPNEVALDVCWWPVRMNAESGRRATRRAMRRTRSWAGGRPKTGPEGDEQPPVPGGGRIRPACSVRRRRGGPRRDAARPGDPPVPVEIDRPRPARHLEQGHEPGVAAAALEDTAPLGDRDLRSLRLRHGGESPTPGCEKTPAARPSRSRPASPAEPSSRQPRRYPRAAPVPCQPTRAERSARAGMSQPGRLALRCAVAPYLPETPAKGWPRTLARPSGWSISAWRAGEGMAGRGVIPPVRPVVGAFAYGLNVPSHRPEQARSRVRVRLGPRIRARRCDGKTPPRAIEVRGPRWTGRRAFPPTPMRES